MLYNKVLADELSEVFLYYTRDVHHHKEDAIQLTIAYAILKHGVTVGQSVSISSLGRI
jgi:hypothetical protein